MLLKANDIAKMLGVSPATVSIAINNKPGISEDMRRRVIEKIYETGSTHLLKDRKDAHNAIGFVVYKGEGSIIDESPFFQYMLSGVTQSVVKYGYQLSFCYMSRTMPRAEQIRLLKSGDYKGLIIFAVEMFDEDLQVFKDSHIPFVTVDNSFQESDVDAITINNTQGTARSVEYLYNMGHRHIGYIMSRQRIDSFDERLATFKKKIADFGLRFDEATDVVRVTYSEKMMKEGMSGYLRAHRDDLPTAFLAENDLIGCNAVKALQEAGLNVPGDVSVIGFDNRPICTLLDPALTTINVQKEMFGPLAVDLLLAKIKEPRDYSIKIVMGTSMIERKSVRRIEAK